MIGVLVAYAGMGPVADAFGWQYVILVATCYSLLSLLFLAKLVFSANYTKPGGESVGEARGHGIAPPPAMGPRR